MKLVSILDICQLMGHRLSWDLGGGGLVWLPFSPRRRRIGIWLLVVSGLLAVARILAALMLLLVARLCVSRFLLLAHEHKGQRTDRDGEWQADTHSDASCSTCRYPATVLLRGCTSRVGGSFRGWTRRGRCCCCRRRRCRRRCQCRCATVEEVR